MFALIFCNNSYLFPCLSVLSFISLKCTSNFDYDNNNKNICFDFQPYQRCSSLQMSKRLDMLTWQQFQLLLFSCWEHSSVRVRRIQLTTKLKTRLKKVRSVTSLFFYLKSTLVITLKLVVTSPLLTSNVIEGGWESFYVVHVSFEVNFVFWLFVL